MQPGEVPEVVILRLPLYVRALTQLQREGANVASSQQLGDRLQMTPAQIRKDLSYFGRFGKQGRGYSIRFLLDELRGHPWPDARVAGVSGGRGPARQSDHQLHRIRPGGLRDSGGLRQQR